MRRAFVFLALLALTAPVRSLEKPPPLLAVLEFDAPVDVMDQDGLALLTDALRSAVKKEVGGVYKVLTRETMVELVPPERLSCFAGKCVAEIGRMLQAPYVIAGSVRPLGAKRVLTIEAYESAGGQLLGSEQIRGQDTESLLDQLDQKARGLVRSWLKLGIPASSPTEPATSRAATEASVGSLVVTSDVEGAEVSIDGRPQGVSIGRKETSFSLPPGRKQVKVSKSGYLDDLQTVELSAGRSAKVQAHLEAETKTAIASAPMEGGTTSFLTVTSEPKGAVITLDGKKVGKTPRSLDVSPGKHRVQLGLEWYVDAQTEVTVAEGATQKVSLVLAADFGEVEVSTAPTQATVFLDGTQVGTTDPTLSLPRVTPGRHTLKVQKSDFHDVEQPFEVEAGKTLKLTVPALKPSVGALRIVSEPAGASVELDKRRVGKTPVTVERLGAGAHAVKLTLDDHDDFEGSASVVEGVTREFSATLESLMGTLSVTSVPAGQAVSVDGDSKGVTPLKLTLLEGEHRLRVGTSGSAFAVKEERITLVRGQTRKGDWTLEELFGRLVVLTDPPEATVVLDGKEVGVSPLQLAKVSAGEHTLEARLKKHDGASQTVHVEPNKESKVRLELAGYEQGEFDEASGDCPAGFVKIPAGTFTMGSENDPEAERNERPAHKVTLSAFCLARTEVTQAEWLRVMGTSPSRFSGEKRPVEQVNWHDAVAYCNKRSQREGLRAAYDSKGDLVRGANGYRLPTEAEWEYAARAGTKTSRYGELDAIAWFDGTSGGQTHDVATKKANAWGLYDMLGNVWEWTNDWYDDYGGEAQRDPQGPSSGSFRATRGGSWNVDASCTRAALRDVNEVAGFRYFYLGMRPARPLP